MTRGSNPLSSDRMTALERRRELCVLLGIGLVRLRMRNSDFTETVRNGRDPATTHPPRTER
ncbi:MAG: hypothetical protein FJX25_09005 [Alphaproteobacteria bacterium]|nr:hypothetical protein [Alphaproteobacteria bacterium]